MDTILAALITVTLLADPAVTVETYPVVGTTRAEVMASMRENRPTYDGWTHWKIDWDWPGYGTAACKLADAEVRLTITVTLPRWDPTDDALWDLMRGWRRFVLDLAEHETGHVALAIFGQMAMVRAIQAADCATADAAAREVIAGIKEQQNEYDRATWHGMDQVRYP